MTLNAEAYSGIALFGYGYKHGLCFDFIFDLVQFLLPLGYKLRGVSFCYSSG